MTIDTAVLADLQAGLIRLDRGAHDSREDGHCAMETVAWLAGEDHTDAPRCASPVLARYTIRLNDRWTDEQRQALVPYLPRMVGTGGDGQDAAREAIARQALVTDLLPAWLRLAGMDAEADALAATPEGGDVYAALRRARDAAWDRRQAALQGVRDAMKAKLAERSADAVAVAVADAAAAAAADAAAVEPGMSYSAAYKAARAYYDAHPLPISQQIADLAAEQRPLALELLDALIRGDES